MKIDIKPLDQVYDECLADGSIRDQSTIDIERIKSLVDTVEEGLKVNSKQWSMIKIQFKIYVDSLLKIVKEKMEELEISENTKEHNTKDINYSK